MAKYLNPADHNPARISRIDKNIAIKDFARKLDFKNIRFCLKIRDIHKTEKKNCINISAFGYENKEKFPVYVSKKTFERYVELLLSRCSSEKF